MAGSLDARETARYSRHLTLPEVGLEGQQRMRSASVLLVGVGGLGSPLGLYLAAAGIGRLGLVDFDRVELSNLQRQVLFGTADVGRSKTAIAAARLRDLNPHIDVVCHDTRLQAANAREILRPYDIVVDGTDNFPTRYLVNDACVLLGKPNVYGSIFRFEGQVSLFDARSGPCYRCLYPQPPAPGSVPNCAEGGVLGVLPGIIGALQAIEAIKWILGRGDGLQGRLLLFDALEMRFRELRLRKDPDCPVCGEHPTLTDLRDEQAGCAVAGPPVRDDAEIDAEELKRRLDAGETPLLLDVRTPEEWAICRLAGATLIPLPELEERLETLDPGREIVVYCRVGMRGATAASLLAQHGFSRVRNLSGGILAWARRVDPDMPQY